MIQAEFEDLIYEQRKRLIEKGKIIWKTKDGKVIPIKDLTDQHLNNIINHIIEKENRYEEYLDSLSGFDF